MTHTAIKHLILGGARSGKSAYAEKLATQLAKQRQQPLLYIATAQAGDREMAARIAKHQQDRHSEWQLIEEPKDLPNALNSITQESVVLIDCLTLWLNNCLYVENADWQQDKTRFLSALAASPHTVFMVSNEIGLGVIPMGQLTREYVDQLGWLHQDLAQLCDNVTLTVAGLPHTLK